MNGNAKICSNSAQSKVYANSYISTAQSLTKPPLDAAGTYAGGDWNHPVCSTGSFTFDGNGTRDSSVGSITHPPRKRVQLHRLQELEPRRRERDGHDELEPGHEGAGGLRHPLSRRQPGHERRERQLHGQRGRSSSTAGRDLRKHDRLRARRRGQRLDLHRHVERGTRRARGRRRELRGRVRASPPASCTSPAAWSMSGNAQIDVLAYVVGCFQQTGTSYVTGPVTTDQGVMSGTPKHTDVLNPPPGRPAVRDRRQSASWGHVVPEQLAPDAGGLSGTSARISRADGEGMSLRHSLRSLRRRRIGLDADRAGDRDDLHRRRGRRADGELCREHDQPAPFGDGRHRAHAGGSSDRGLQEPPVRLDSARVVDHPERQRPVRDRSFERRLDSFLHRPDHGWHAGVVLHRVDAGCGRVRHADLDGARQPAVPGGHLHRHVRRRPEGEPSSR